VRPKASRVWGAAVAAVVAFTPLLAAQKLTDKTMPLPQTSTRQRQLEPAVGHMYEVWRVAASPELLLGWYLRALNRLSPSKDAVLDTADVMMGNTRPPMTYHIALHSFKDQCADNGDTTHLASDTTYHCTQWRIGKQKLRTLDDNRVGFGFGDWIESITFMWYIRELTGEIVRRRIELRDVGLSDDWKRYTLLTQITLERDTLKAASQAP
jgi:hypothetical protein